jgi:hypothetical protein
MVTAHWLNDVLQKKKLFVPNLAIHYPSPFEPSEPEKLPLAKASITITGFEGISILLYFDFYLTVAFHKSALY